MNSSAFREGITSWLNLRTCPWSLSQRTIGDTCWSLSMKLPASFATSLQMKLCVRHLFHLVTMVTITKWLPCAATLLFLFITPYISVGEQFVHKVLNPPTLRNSQNWFQS